MRAQHHPAAARCYALLRTQLAVRPCLTALVAAALPPAPGKPEVLFRHVRAWADFTRPLAVLRLAQPPSALHYVPGWRDSSPPRFLSVGDSAGGLLLLSPGGQLLAQHATGVLGCVGNTLRAIILGRLPPSLAPSPHPCFDLRQHPRPALCTLAPHVPQARARQSRR